MLPILHIVCYNNATLLQSEETIMAHKISDSCVNCGACSADCPAEAISENNGQHVIDPAKCTDCGACVSACPTEAISAE